MPQRFRELPRKPSPPSLDDAEIAEWMADMDEAYDVLRARYDALVEWVTDAP